MPPLRPARTLALLLALVANLVATGVPVLHALAHEAEEAHHPSPEHPALPQVDHGHDEIHAEALHDAGVLVKRQVLDLACILPGEVETPGSFSSTARLQHRPALPLTSRAPPTTDSARAPPTR